MHGGHLRKHFLFGVERSSDVEVGTETRSDHGKTLYCSDTTKAGVSLHKFSSDKSLQRRWILQVKRTRANLKESSAFSVVCSEHFTEDCFEGMAEQLGLKMKRMLKPAAVPTIFPRVSTTPTVARKSIAYAKRQTFGSNSPACHPHGQRER